MRSFGVAASLCFAVLAPTLSSRAEPRAQDTAPPKVEGEPGTLETRQAIDEDYHKQLARLNR